MTKTAFIMLRKQESAAEYIEIRAAYQLSYSQWEQLIRAIPNAREDRALMGIINEIERQAMGLPSLPPQKEKKHGH